MKTKEEVQQLAESIYKSKFSSNAFVITESKGYVKGYTQCEEDMAEKIRILEKEIDSMYEDLAGEDI